MDNGTAKSKVDVVPAASEASAKEAADSCPVACITIA
jgi:ferredoxin